MEFRHATAMFAACITGSNLPHALDLGLDHFQNLMSIHCVSFRELPRMVFQAFA
jgi:hypothetical protein